MVIVRLLADLLDHAIAASSPASWRCSSPPAYSRDWPSPVWRGPGRRAAPGLGRRDPWLGRARRPLRGHHVALRSATWTATTWPATCSTSPWPGSATTPCGRRRLARPGPHRPVLPVGLQGCHRHRPRCRAIAEAAGSPPWSAPSPSSSRWCSWSGAWRSRSSSESSPCRHHPAPRDHRRPRRRRLRRPWRRARARGRVRAQPAGAACPAAPSTATSWSRTCCGSRSERRDGRR